MANMLGYGLAKGASAVPGEVQRRKEAKARADKAELQLQEYKEAAPVRKSKQDLELAQTQLATRQANAQLLDRQTFDAIQRYDIDGDVRHLNTFLDSAKKNPLGAGYRDVVRLEKLSDGPRSREIDALLRNMNLDPEVVYADPQTQDSLLLGTGPDGKYKLVNMLKLKALTRYDKYATNEQLAQDEKRARIMQMQQSGVGRKEIDMIEELAGELISNDVSKVEAYRQAREAVKGRTGSSDAQMIRDIAEEENLSLSEASTMFYSQKRQGSGETNESRFIKDYMEENPGASKVQASEAYANRSKTATQKNIQTADEIRDELDEMNYLDLKESELSRTDRNKVNRKVMNLVKAGDVNVSAEEKKTLRNLRQLVEFGGPAAEGITAEETGLFDKTFNNIKSYFSDEIGGKEATAAYESLRNVLRHELFGATVPEGEMDAFNAAIGTLGQKTGPVLAKLRTQLGGMRAKLAQIRDMNDAYVIKHFTGATDEQLDTIIDGLDNRISAIKGMIPTESKNKIVEDPGLKIRKISSTAPPVQPGTPKPSLDDIFGGL